ncbi:similar to Saccharomyces cerevisiae YFR005C SAD1 Conserved zinc-finger domain protein involved in pre-mRNA splicing, required for assembly of U4 snRNA into the U4/U6 particle [Maudiozyma barnettii]|uniref:Similar to Saccharomyces cerevisiae YFR005C SAD1 Conserved zinc-finger domain protein involved in pre-mRNA splicing, required for assembly of U4 snRNA into the U4/U6 particle n=1 Tax=Maudiozyma barnettii TaxID=61262 RepID=A0A8H2VF53_9SACH|nr:mRNA splicing protein SAD1 [Kazachstania barnettii]CAB4254385.1 similar to Saccharomyces cerevisiae YFR005C SAD1 Conserved zinc-finger domain protein involved in pre-mRNA splicing, required for assembly of U4 snRNA into the U4/U6 particle [Kazachstania barnettii]CAD1782281.1 similar to Saccharomyces cerevisiae YFR005C SAD1 Conserved zinc-finger domain protein involved in pre-mRNA splicing, required for assembly of U4 snRNA into the U4/U6 particle [Kazachstania barnettii]
MTQKRLLDEEIQTTQQQEHPKTKRQKQPVSIQDEEVQSLMKTINRKKLDFDSEKICSVTLSKLDIYGCLICGKYYRGCKERTPAFLHSVSDDHRLFVSFQTSRVVVLPDEIDIDLNTMHLGDVNKRLIHDIKYSVNPVYTSDIIQRSPYVCFESTQGQSYYNGIVGLNKSTSNNIAYINVVIQLLAHIGPIRDYFLLCYNKNLTNENGLIKNVALIMKKIWSPHLFKLNIGPDELISYLMVNHSNVIKANNNLDPQIFLNWLINTLCQSDKQLRKILTKACQGKLKVSTKGNKIKVVPFWNLTLILPEISMFKESKNVDDIKQIKLEKLIMEKFSMESTDNGKLYLIKENLPQYLFLYISRFNKSKNLNDSEFYVRNRNQTIVNFDERLSLPLTNDKGSKIQYKLISNIVHDPEKNLYDIEKDYTSNWKIQLPNNQTKDWVEIDNTRTTVRNFNLLFLDETCIQVWEKIVD